VDLTVLSGWGGFLVAAVLVTVVAYRPVLTVHQVVIVASHVLQVKQLVTLACDVLAPHTIVCTDPVLPTVVRVGVQAH